VPVETIASHRLVFGLGAVPPGVLSAKATYLRDD
jgi:hypothetical protein